MSESLIVNVANARWFEHEALNYDNKGGHVGRQKARAPSPIQIILISSSSFHLINVSRPISLILLMIKFAININILQLFIRKAFSQNRVCNAPLDQHPSCSTNSANKDQR